MFGKDQRIFDSKEELANSLTHGIGLLLSVIGLIILVSFARGHDDPWRIVIFSVYGLSLVVLYGASTVYHWAKSERLKQIFKIMDHCAIYFLIAGTYTPITLIPLKGPWGWGLFFAVWGLALGGVVFKIFFVNRFETLSTIIYLIMGWLIVIAVKPFIECVSISCLSWIAAGGFLYSVGVIFYSWETPRYNHTIWHLFVLGGSICHFLALYLYILPM